MTFYFAFQSCPSLQYFQYLSTEIDSSSNGASDNPLSELQNIFGYDVLWLAVFDVQK